MLMMLVLSIPIWASEHTVTISRGEVLNDTEVDGMRAYYCIKDGVMMTFTGGLDNDNYLVESNNKRFEVRSANYVIKRIVFHCMDNTLEGNYDSFYWGPTTISAVTNFTYPGQLGNYTVTNNGYDGVWTGTTNAIQFLTKGHPVRFGSVEIVYDKLDGDIFELVTNNSQIVDGQTYIIASQYHNKVMAFKKTDDASYPVTDVVEWMNDSKTKVKVNGNACLFKMENVQDSTIGGNTRKVAWFNTLNGHIREGSGTNVANLISTTSLNDYARAIMYISANENANNYLCWFKNGTGSATKPIRYDYDGSHLLKIMPYSDQQTRVWLYKLAQSYSITTACDPVNGGNVTLGNGVVNGTSQEGETVHFHVGTNWGYRIMQVIVTDETGATITVNTDATAADGNDYSFVMPAANVTVTARFYETEPDLYLVGTAMGRTNWVPAGPKFEYDPINQEYNLDVYFKGGADDLSTSLDDQAYGYFSLATHIDSGTHWQDAPAHSGDWSQVTGRLAAEVNNKLVADGETGIALYNDRPDNAFKIPAGIYRITVNRAMTQMSIVQTPVQLFFDPESNTEVDPGTTVTITSDILQKVQPIAARHGIEENRLDYVYKTDEMNNWAYVYDAHQATLEITKIGETQVAAICSLNYIEAKDTAYYRIPEYEINTVVTPEGAGTINIPVTSSVAGETITFTVDTNYAHSLNAVTLTTGDTQTVLTPDEQGNYTFVMPRGNVTITASFNAIPVYSIQAVVIPSPAGTINVASSAMAGETVEFTITNSSATTYDDYDIFSLTVTTNDSQETIAWTRTGSTYSFVMPDEDVTITLEYRKFYMVRAVWTPENGGVVGIGADNATQSNMMVGRTVTFQVVPNANFEIGSIRVGYNVPFVDHGDGTYSFVMPNVGVIINVTFIPVGAYQVDLVNDPAEGGSTSLSGHVKTENGNYYSDAGETVVITPEPNTGWAATAVDVVDAQNNPVTVTANGDGTYSLVMPASNVTITTHYVRAPFTITTQVTPEGKGTITLMGDAADYDEIAFQTVTFSVEPVLDYVISSVYYTIETGSTHYPVTDNGDGTYSFVMPESNVIIVAELKEAERIFRRIKHHRDIIEGGKYVYVDYYDGVVMGREYADKPTVLGDVFPKQMLDGGERVSVFSNAAVFEIVNLVDTTYNPQSLDYGWLGEVPYKAAYLKMVDDGSYIGLPDNPVFPYAAELFDVDNPNEKFENLRVLLRVEDRSGFWQNHLSMNGATWSYYPYVWPHPLISREYHEGEYLKWNIGYSSEHETFYVGRDHPIYLYKMPQPFTVTTRCVEQGWGDIQLSGVDGNIAMDGDVVTVTPVAATGYGFVELTVTINGTGEVLDVTDNHDGTYSFVMPAADVTVTATYGPAHRLTLTVAPESIGHCVYSSLVIDDADIDFMGETPTYYQQNDVLPNVPVNFGIRLDDYYAIKSVTITNDNTGEVSELLINEIDDDEDPGYLCLFWFNMPNNDATITVNVVPGHKVTCVPMLYDSESGDYVEVDPDQCGRINVDRNESDDNYRPTPLYFEKDDEMTVYVSHNEGYRLDHVTAVCDATGEVIEMTVSSEDMLPGIYSEVFYEFSMPDADVTVTAYYAPFTPLALIEKPLRNMNNSDNGFIDDNPVTVDDELIGVWAVANPETGEKLLWAKDQSPYRSYDWVERPEGTIDYVRQNMKLQKKDWSQSNWVVLDFSNLLESWEGSEESFNQKMEDLVDHKIIAGTVKGTYHCEGDVVKAKHRIVLDEWPQAVNPNDVTSLGYPGYAEDPKEEKAYDYKYNHYVPANFMKEYVSGLYGGLEAGDDGIVPGAVAGNPDYADKRWFFMKPKDAEVAQVWAVWLGSYELYDEFSDETRDGHVFETYVSDPDNGVNMYDFGGAFFVPSWDYNRWTTGDGVDHYGYPEGEVSLVVNTDYLFHVAIETHGEKYDDDEPLLAPRRGQGTQAREDDPWSYYSVYPLDLDPTNSTTTGLNEVNAPASTTIDSIRYYNVMGQENKTPFDGINIMVIRYKDGSMISKKILR